MKISNYAHYFTYLGEVLLSQRNASRFKPELLAETLEQSLYAIIEHGCNNGEKAETVIRKFDATGRYSAFTLMNVFRKIHFQQLTTSTENLH